MRSYVLLLSLCVLVSLFSESCKTKKKKKAEPAPPIVVTDPEKPPETPESPKPEPSYPAPNPDTPPAPEKPKEEPKPVPEPNPEPKIDPLPLDPFNRPIIPATPIIPEQHIVLNTGVVQVYRTGSLTVDICADRAVYAYFIPCTTSLKCWEWFNKTTCGYFICQRFFW